jgi:acyl carrier protein
MQSTISTIKNIIAKLKHQPELAEELGDDADLINEVGLDSLGLLQFMLEVEERMNIQIDFNLLEFDYLQSIQTLAGFLEQMPKRVPTGQD